MGYRPNLTKGELRLKLARRIGYAANPRSANQDLLNDLLEQSNEEIYETLSSWAPVTADTVLPTVVDQWQYDWPEALDPDRIEYIYVQIYGNQFIPLTEGFDVATYDLRDDYTSWPSRFRRRAQLEVWPTPDAVYSMYIGAQGILPAFDADTDRTAAPHDIVLSQAIVYAYENQGRPVPGHVSKALDRRLNQVRARSHPQEPYDPLGRGNVRPVSRPRIAPGGAP